MRKNDILNKVNEFVTELGLNYEILGLKTTDDKILYYYNYLDPRNMFKGLVEFPSQYFIRLINYLCKDEGKLQEYIDNFYDSEDFTFGIAKFKKYIENTRDLKVNGYILQKQLDRGAWQEFWESLQELYLDPTDDCYLSSFQERIAEGLNGKDIYEWYKRKNGRLLTITTFAPEYIKTIVNK